MKKEIVFFSGLPRTGSHLLSNILNENPEIHSEGTSSVCSASWKINQIFDDNLIHELSYFDRDSEKLKKKMIHNFIDEYYNGVSANLIIDKSRSWTMPDNISIIKKYITKNPKFIIMTRDIEEIVKSFLYIFIKNGIDCLSAEKEILNIDEFGSNPLMRPISAMIYANINNKDDFLFIEYNDLVENPKQTIDSVYDFIGLKKFDHNLKHIKQSYAEKDTLILDGIISHRPTISKREILLDISDKAMEKILYINNIIRISKKDNISAEELAMINNFCEYNSF